MQGLVNALVATRDIVTCRGSDRCRGGYKSLHLDVFGSPQRRHHQSGPSIQEGLRQCYTYVLAHQRCRRLKVSGTAFAAPASTPLSWCAGLGPNYGEHKQMGA